MKISHLLFSTLMLVFVNKNHAQILTNYEPCLTGSENSCRCLTSPIFCSPDSLDGFTYKMTRFLHPSDGPGNPMCLASSGTTAHNPTWIRFVAWCEDIDLEIITTNCSIGLPNCPSRGVQIAVFPSCNWQNPNNAVACEVDYCLNAAPWSQNIPVKMKKLNVGKFYSILLDGCCGSACDVQIKVVPNNCLTNKEFNISGPDTVAIQNDYEYKITFPKGTTRLTIEQGNLLTSVGTYDTSTSYIYKTKFYDQGSSSIFAYTDYYCFFDSIISKRVTVLKPNAGKINYLNNYFCPTDSIVISIDSTQKYKEFKNYIVLSDTSGIVKHITDQSNIKILNKTCEKYDVYSFNLLKMDTSFVKFGDSIHHVIKKCDSSVCDYLKRGLNLKELNLPPNFINPPVDITLSCPMGLENTSIPLSYSNNVPPGPCLIGGTVNSENTTLIEGCNGVYKKAWTFSNACHTIEHSQLIHISSNEAKFINPPKDTTIKCEDIDINNLPTLSYTNNVPGLCNISGNVTAISTNNIIDCTGYILRTWEYTEPCGRILKHTQKINVVKTSETTDLGESLVLKSSVYTKTLFLELINNKGNKRFRVTNIEGKVMCSGDIENKLEVDISSYSSGLYFISVDTKSQTVTSKIFIP